MTHHCNRHTLNHNGLPQKTDGGEAGNVLIVVLVLVAIAGAALWWFQSRPATLSSNASEYFKNDPEVPREGNAWFVLMGLDVLADRPALDAGLQKFDIMRGQKAHGPVPPELTFSGDIDSISCWVNAQPDVQGCPDMGALDVLLSENFDLLSRLENLLEYNMAVQPRGTGGTVSSELVENLFHLKMAELVMLLEQARPEDSIEIWVNGWRQLRMLSVARVDLAWRGVFAELLGQWAGLFPYIIAAQPEQLEKGGARRMFYLLRPLDEDGLNFKARLKHLGHLLVYQALEQTSLEGTKRKDLETRLKNIYANNAVLISKALDKNSEAEAYAALMALRNRNAGVTDEVPGDMAEDVAAFMQDAINQLIGAFQADMANNDYSRMFILDIDAYDKNVPVDRMQAYLDIQQEFMQSHVTGQPFAWDPERFDIHFIAPDNLERRLNILRLQQKAAENDSADKDTATPEDGADYGSE